MKNQPQHIYIGSYNNGKKKPGIYDLVSKDMIASLINVNLVNPSYVLVRNRFIYAIQQTDKGRLNVISNTYQLIKTVLTHGDGPCHISINDITNRIVCSNYDSGSFSMYELKQGIPDKFLSLVVHQGSSVDKQRQASPHPHCSVFSFDGRILFVSDLGTDIIYYYTVNYDGSQNLVCEKQKCLKITGCGPRHLARGQSNQKLLYLTGELDSSIRVLSYSSGKLQLLSSYRVSNNIHNQPSQVIYTNGTVWMGNRGDDNLILFDSTTLGTLKQVLRFKVGKQPRHFKISKQGYIYVACQSGNSVQMYEYINGKIIQIGGLKITTPTCISFQQN